MFSPAEKKILKKISQNGLVRKGELVLFLEENGSKDPETIIDSVTESLRKKDYILKLSPIGGTCFAITKAGNGALDNIE